MMEVLRKGNNHMTEKLYKTPIQGSKTQEKIDKVITTGIVVQNQNKRVERKHYSLKYIINTFKSKSFEFPEDYQRAQVTSWSGFGRQWVSTLFGKDGFSHFDKLHIREVVDDTGHTKLQVVEGGQRLRSIYDFFQDDSKYHLDEDIIVPYHGKILNIGGLTWKELSNLRQYSPELDSYLEDVLVERTFDVSLYVNYPIDEIADIFRKINNKTKLNDQEMRNAFGGEACIAIRKTARFDAEPHKTFKLHPLFEVVTSSSGKNVGRWTKISFGRYEMERTLAELCLFEDDFDKNAHFSIGIQSLDAMYERYSKEGSFRKLLNTVKDRLTLIHNMVQLNDVTRNSGMILNKGTLFTLYCLLFHVEKYYLKNSEVEFEDPRKFFMWFWLTHTELSQVKTYDPVQNKLVVQIDPVTSRPVESAYGLKTRKAHRNKDELEGIFNEWEKVFEPLVNDPIQLKNLGIILKDKRRTISDKDALTVYARQDGKDALTGQIMPIDDLVKGHIVAHSKGGDSTVDNTVLINKFDNLKQGSQHYDDYVKEKAV